MNYENRTRRLVWWVLSHPSGYFECDEHGQPMLFAGRNDAIIEQTRLSWIGRYPEVTRVALRQVELRSNEKRESVLEKLERGVLCA